jgi:hypothetical protein
MSTNSDFWSLFVQVANGAIVLLVVTAPFLLWRHHSRRIAEREAQLSEIAKDIKEIKHRIPSRD